MKLLTTSNTKTLKGEAQGYLTFGLGLAPTTVSGYNVCPGASAECRQVCLNWAGMGVFSNVQAARITKTKLFFEDRERFMAQLVKEIAAGVKKATKLSLTPVFRLNLYSDIRWENIPVYTSVTSKGVTTIYHANSIMEAFPHVQFYDYTKLSNRKNIPANYHLTFSRSEENELKALKVLQDGGSVAVVFDTKKGEALPETWAGYEVVDGDTTDLRFLDKQNVVVGLRAKGKAKAGRSGFVVLTHNKES